MARVIGPLLSEQARGKLGDSLVYTRRRGQNVVRSFVVPSNPQTANQMTQRSRLRVNGRIIRRVNVGRWKYAAEAMSIKDYYTERVRVGEVWNSALAREMLGAANANFIASLAVWEALADNIQLLWTTEAESAIGGLMDETFGGVTYDSGFQLLLVQRTIGAAGYGVFNSAMPTDLTQAA